LAIYKEMKKGDRQIYVNAWQRRKEKNQQRVEEIWHAFSDVLDGP